MATKYLIDDCGAAAILFLVLGDRLAGSDRDIRITGPHGDTVFRDCQIAAALRAFPHGAVREHRAPVAGTAFRTDPSDFAHYAYPLLMG